MARFDGKDFTGKARGFEHPTQLPVDGNEAREWQEANRYWWEQAPMGYDWRKPIDAPVGTRAYFQEIDRRFFGSVFQYMPWKSRPFDNLIDFDSLTGLDVLEIGVGLGSHAQLIAPHCRNYVGIDLTHRAVNMTQTRLKLNGINADILQMDAERMSFSDSSFDLIWSWGVIHHSANTRDILTEMRRVLKPQGSAIVMVYYRSLWKYYVMDGAIKGILLGGLARTGSFHGINQASTDGAIARYYNAREWKELCMDILPVKTISITGQKQDIIPLPAGALKDTVNRLFPNSLARLLTNRLRFGSFLISRLTCGDKPLKAAERGLKR